MSEHEVASLHKNVLCRCCGASCEFFSKAKVLSYDGVYYRCRRCLSVQIDNPTWIVQSHSRAISALDTGLVSRCVSASKIISTFLYFEGKPNSVGIDWGGGTGLLTRLMRDLGYKMSNYDKYSDGYLAEGFQATLEDFNHPTTFITSIECFEHLEDPLTYFWEATKKTEYFFFTTEIIPFPTPDPAASEWWYFLPETGQHITFLSAQGLIIMKEKLEFKNYLRIGTLHVFSRAPIKKRTKNILAIRVFRMLALVLVPIYLSKRYSLILRDQEELRHRMN